MMCLGFASYHIVGVESEGIGVSTEKTRLVVS